MSPLYAETNDAITVATRSLVDEMEEYFCCMTDYTPTGLPQFSIKDGEHKMSRRGYGLVLDIDDDKLLLLQEHQNRSNIHSRIKVRKHDSQPIVRLSVLRSKCFLVKSTVKKLIRKLRNNVAKAGAKRSSPSSTDDPKRSFSLSVVTDADSDSDSVSTYSTDATSHSERLHSDSIQQQRESNLDRIGGFRSVWPSTSRFTEKGFFHKCRSRGRNDNGSRIQPSKEGSDDGLDQDQLEYADLKYRVERYFLEPFL